MTRNHTAIRPYGIPSGKVCSFRKTLKLVDGELAMVPFRDLRRGDVFALEDTTIGTNWQRVVDDDGKNLWRCLGDPYYSKKVDGDDVQVMTVKCSAEDAQ